MNYVYHGSSILNLEVIKKHKSTDIKNEHMHIIV